MKPRAVIFDIYNTLLEVQPPPADSSERWTSLWLTFRKTRPPLLLSEFDARCEKASQVAQTAAQKRGVLFPEVNWAEVARTACPELDGLPDTELDEFLFKHAHLQRTVCLMSGAFEVLTKLVPCLPLGICSNCQPYSLRELAASLGTKGLSPALFQPDLCFYSFKAGFRKPNPAAFELLQQALTARHIAPEEVLMVGDRMDNDILPARAQGWQTWHLSATSPEPE